jgi:Ribosomal protein L22p/L17e
LDVDQLRVHYAVVNEGPTLKRFTPAAMGRATPIKKRTSHVEIHVVAAAAPRAPKAAAAAVAEPAERKRGGKGKAATKRAPTKAKAAAAGASSKKKEGK